jgi:hypothetical protein
VKVFVDLETINLVEGRGIAWEVGLIAGGHEYLWQVKPDLALADPKALEVGRFPQRFTEAMGSERIGTGMRMIHPTLPGLLAESRRQAFEFAAARVPARQLAAEIADLTAGAELWGSNPAFDMRHLTVLLGEQGITPAWHYHPGDIPSMARGWCAARGVTPTSAKGDGRIRSDDWSRAVGIDPDAFNRHSALGDARWVRAQYELMTGGAS